MLIDVTIFSVNVTGKLVFNATSVSTALNGESTRAVSQSTRDREANTPLSSAITGLNVVVTFELFVMEIVTLAPGAPVPVTVGCLLSVIPSVSETPVSVCGVNPNPVITGRIVSTCSGTVTSGSRNSCLGQCRR